MMGKHCTNKWKFTVAIAVSLLMAISMWMTGCDKEDEVDERFSAAAEVTQTWCVESQRVVAGFDEATLSDDMIFNDVYDLRGVWSSQKSQVKADADPPVEIRVWIEPYCDVELPAPKDLSERIYCKMPNQDRISSILEITPSSEPGTCRSRNEAAFAWALDQLTPAEREKYEVEGHQVRFLDDVVVGTGGEWLGMEAHFELADDGVYEVASPSLQSEYVPNPEDPQTLDGVHYCKLVSPTQALYWVLHRGFKEDPGKCIQEEQCPDPEAVPTGSCIFFFPTSEQHFCEEYRGGYWDEELAIAKCEDRALEGHPVDFKPVSCADRPEDTDDLDGDGEYKGTCLVVCGYEERVWRVYSSSGDLDPSGFCDWAPAE
ncbi:MAG: hypothetical protein GY762_16510 [Proteobacteria bacterium]|nr:hypothetical protein [Pseudomonadota bacterium]